MPLQAIVVPLIVLSMLPIPLITIRSAGFGFATMAAPIVLAIGVMVAHARGVRLGISYLGLFALVMGVGVISVINSWLFWDPNVGTAQQFGFGHRWIGYQVTALYFLATPFVALLAGMVYAQLERLTSLYVGVLLSVTVTTLLGLWSWAHHPVNPLNVYLHGARPNINPDATLFLVALSTAVLIWQRHRPRYWIPAAVLLCLGLVAAALSYALNCWLGCVGAIVVLIWSRWRWRGVLVLVIAALALAQLAQPTIGTILAQRLGGNDLDRIGLWHSALIVWSKSPIIGVGAGNFDSYMERYSVFGIGLVVQGYHEAHNVFLELLAELGVIGLLSFFAYLIAIMVRLGRRFPGQALADRHFQSAALAMLVGSALMAAVGSGIVPTIASAGWEGIPPVLVSWFFAGAAVANTMKRSSLVRRSLQGAAA